MKKPLFSIICLGLALSMPGTAEDTKSATPAPEKPAPGTVVELFDGKTLKGWRKVGGNGLYKVEDGAIVGYGEEKGIKGNTFLRTEETYGDFELTFEFKFDDRSGNSGMMFRALQKPSEDGDGRVYGYQCEHDNKDRSWTAGLYDEARRGWLFPNKGNKEHCAEFTKQGKPSTQ